MALHVRIEGLVGNATAILAAEPPSDQLDLLHAGGVSYRGGEPCAGGFRARFHKRVDQHPLAGLLGRFLPQLWSRVAGPGVMRIDEANAH